VVRIQGGVVKKCKSVVKTLKTVVKNKQFMGWQRLTNFPQGLLPSAGHLVGSRSVRESWPRLLPAARPSPSTLPLPQQFPTLRPWPSQTLPEDARALRREAMMLSDPPESCHPIARRGPHGSNLPCCLPPPRRPETVAAGCPEPVWTFCALTDRFLLHRPVQPPRSFFRQRGSCNQTLRPRPPHRNRPLK
jgi:hypothetical protein